jgi:hypothetical protein
MISAGSGERAALDQQVLAMIHEGVDARRDDARFGALALQLFRHQYAHNAAYQRLCDAADARPDEIDDWKQIPPAPTGAFKEARLACFPSEADVRVFRTSGTTTRARGALHLDTLTLYEASLLETFGSFLCPEGSGLRFAILAPSPDAAPDSSLSYMFGCAVRALGEGECRYFLAPDTGRAWNPDALLAELHACRMPIALCGTAFAFVHLIDRMTERAQRLSLAPGSRIMETGGFKGRSREVPRDVLHAELSRRLGVPPWRIVNQYGMCELGSQFYEPSLREGRETSWKMVPPWVRSRALDPATLSDVPDGEIGVLAHYDLANTGSVLAVLTADRGRVRGGRLQVVGRLEGAEARGCSIAADALLQGR